MPSHPLPLASLVQVCAPKRLLAGWRRRVATSYDVGVVVVAPVLVVATLIVAAANGVSVVYAGYLLPASLAALTAILCLVGAALITAGGRPAQSIVPTIAPSCPQPPLVLDDQTECSPDAGAPPSATAGSSSSDAGPSADDRAAMADVSFTPTARRSLSMQPIIMSSSEQALAEAVSAGVSALGSSRAATAAAKKRAPIFERRPIFSLPYHLRRGWRVRGLLSRVCLVACAVIIEDGIATVVIPLLCLTLELPQSPAPILWSAVCAVLSIAACRLGRLAVTTYLSHLLVCGRDSKADDACGVHGRRHRPQEHAAMINGSASIDSPAQSVVAYGTSQRIMTPSRVARTSAPQTPVAAPSSSPPNAAARTPMRGRFDDEIVSRLHDEIVALPAAASPQPSRRPLFGSDSPHNAADDIAFATAQGPAASAVAVTAKAEKAMGTRGALLGACASLVAAPLVLPAAYELWTRLPNLLQIQPQLLLITGSFLLGALLAASTAILHARLILLGDAPSDPAASSSSSSSLARHQICDHTRAPPAAPPPPRAEWRELVDSFRMLGTMIVQPALCAALGLLPTRNALWSTAAVGALAVLIAASAALLLYCPRNGARDVASPDSRRTRLLGDSSLTISTEAHTHTRSDGTPETFLSSSASGDETRASSSPGGQQSATRRMNTLGSTPEGEVVDVNLDSPAAEGGHRSRMHSLGSTPEGEVVDVNIDSPVAKATERSP